MWNLAVIFFNRAQNHMKLYFQREDKMQRRDILERTVPGWPFFNFYTDDPSSMCFPERQRNPRSQIHLDLLIYLRLRQQVDQCRHETCVLSNSPKYPETIQPIFSSEAYRWSSNCYSHPVQWFCDTESKGYHDINMSMRNTSIISMSFPVMYIRPRR